MTRIRFSVRGNAVRSALLAIALLAAILPSAALAAEAGAQSYVVVLKGAYALDGTYD